MIRNGTSIVQQQTDIADSWGGQGGRGTSALKGWKVRHEHLEEAEAQLLNHFLPFFFAHIRSILFILVYSPNSFQCLAHSKAEQPTGSLKKKKKREAGRQKACFPSSNLWIKTRWENKIRQLSNLEGHGIQAQLSSLTADNACFV